MVANKNAFSCFNLPGEKKAIPVAWKIKLICISVVEENTKKYLILYNGNLLKAILFLVLERKPHRRCLIVYNASIRRMQVSMFADFYGCWNFLKFGSLAKLCKKQQNNYRQFKLYVSKKKCLHYRRNPNVSDAAAPSENMGVSFGEKKQNLNRK